MAEKNVVTNERYLSVDSGKYKTKIGLLSNDQKSALTFGFRTMIDEGDFEDDALEAGSFIAEVDGKVYKMGSGAAREATLETTKMSEIHRVTTLAAIALIVNDGDTVNVAIGCPIKEYQVVKKRNAYRDYILPEGEVTIKLKTKNETPPIEKHFTIAYRVVYPESSGVLYLDMERFADKTVGIVDIGGGTALGSLFDNFEIMPNTSFSTEYGGNVLAGGLSQQLSAEFTRCTPDYIRKVLKQPLNKRCLVPINGDKAHIEEVMQKSKESIDNYLVNYVREIKRQCDTVHWPLEYMELVMVGGTSEILANELKIVFGEHIYFPPNLEFANALGFLRRLCAKRLGIIIPVNATASKGLIQGSNAPTIN